MKKPNPLRKLFEPPACNCKDCPIDNSAIGVTQLRADAKLIGRHCSKCGLCQTVTVDPKTNQPHEDKPEPDPDPPVLAMVDRLPKAA